MAGTDTLSRLITAARDGQPLLPHAEALGLEMVTVPITDPDFYGVLIERKDGTLAFGTGTRRNDWLTEAALRRSIEQLAGERLRPATASDDDILDTHKRTPWCTTDHTQELGGNTFTADVTHRREYPGTELDVRWPGRGGDIGTHAFRTVLDVMPFSGDTADQQPTVNVEVIEDHVIEGLDPAGLADVIDKLRAQCDRLDQALVDLVAARAKWNEAQA